MKGWSVSVAVALLFSSGLASADDKAECVAAASSAQDLRVARHLVAAREQLLVCARESCPVVVRRDCVQWFSEVESAMPTIVVGVKDDRGGDLGDARVTIDGRPFSSFDGKAVSFDPGVHVLRAERSDSSPAEETVTIREGEKNRVIALVLTRSRRESATLPESTSASRAPVLAAVLAGVGVVGLGVGSIFGLKTSSRWSDAKDACADGCGAGSQAYSLRDDARTAGTISTLSFIAGGLLIASAAVLFFTSSPAKQTPQ